MFLYFLVPQLEKADDRSIIQEEIYLNFDKAQNEYKASLKKNLSPELESKRSELLSTLKVLQSKLYFVTNESEFNKSNNILLANVTDVYRAKTEQDLTTVQFSLYLIERIINSYKQLAMERKKAGKYAIIVSVCGIVGLGSLMIITTLLGSPSINTVLPIISIPLPILLWSAIGSFAAILYRFNKLGYNQSQDPIRWLWTRPITGVVMGIIAYLMALIGLLAIGSKSTSSASTNVSSLAGTTELFWLIAFIGGFSDRFADGILKTLIGHFGGNYQEDLVTLDITAESITNHTDQAGEGTSPSSNSSENDQTAKPGLNNTEKGTGKPSKPSSNTK